VIGARASEVSDLKPTSVSPWERWRPRRLLLPPPGRRGRQRSQGKIYHGRKAGADEKLELGIPRIGRDEVGGKRARISRSERRRRFWTASRWAAARSRWPKRQERARNWAIVRSAVSVGGIGKTGAAGGASRALSFFQPRRASRAVVRRRPAVWMETLRPGERAFQRAFETQAGSHETQRTGFGTLARVIETLAPGVETQTGAVETLDDSSECLNARRECLNARRQCLNAGRECLNAGSECLNRGSQCLNA